jgi:hypothetical protein
MDGYNVKVQEKVAELIDSLAAEMKLECERLYRSGAIDVSVYNTDFYGLPKVLVTAAMNIHRYSYTPIGAVERGDLENLLNL